MRSIITIVVASALWIGTAGAQTSGKFVYHKQAETLQLVEINVRLIPSPKHLELPKDGEYRINTITGTLSLGDKLVFEVCEWFQWAPVHVRSKISNVLGKASAAGKVIARVADRANQAVSACQNAIGRAQ